MDNFYLQYFAISLLMIAFGVGTKVYLKKTGLNNLNQFLGVGVFWLKFTAYASIIIGVFLLVVNLITLYYHLRYEGYL